MWVDVCRTTFVCFFLRTYSRVDLREIDFQFGDLVNVYCIIALDVVGFRYILN